MQKKIGIILFIIVLLPVLFYSVYEFSSLSESEQFIDEIYQQQMNLILHSVNQYTWEITSKWEAKITQMLELPASELERESRQFLSRNSVVLAIVVSDTVMTSSRVLATPEFAASPDYERIRQLNFLGPQEQAIQRMIYRKHLGYSKIEPVVYRNDPGKSVLLFASESVHFPMSIVAMIIDRNTFVQNLLIPKVNDVARDEFAISILGADELTPQYSTTEISDDAIRLKRKIWMLPDLYLGIALRGTTVEDLAQNRFRRSLWMISLVGLILMFSGVVLYRNIRKEMELARMKADFVSNVSHELRTPLALIRMFAETIEMDRINSDDEKKEYCKIIANESERLTHIINNILDFSKMDAGKKEYHFQQIDLNKVVAEILNIYKYHLDSKGFTLDENINPQPLPIKADRDAISEVLVNLLDNAVKYSDVRKQIRVATGFENQHVFLEISDSGIGISAKDQKRIYQKFYRVAGDHKKPVKGSGLGLTLVKHIMDVHGGRIVLKSKPGEGSRFRLIFNKASEEHTS